MHQRLEVAVEYGLFWPFERLFSPYFTATHDWCKAAGLLCTKNDPVSFVPFGSHDPLGTEENGSDRKNSKALFAHMGYCYLVTRFIKYGIYLR